MDTAMHQLRKQEVLSISEYTAKKAGGDLVCRSFDADESPLRPPLTTRRPSGR